MLFISYRFLFTRHVNDAFFEKRVLDNSGIEEVGHPRIRLFLPGDGMSDLRSGGQFQLF